MVFGPWREHCQPRRPSILSSNTWVNVGFSLVALGGKSIQQKMKLSSGHEVFGLDIEAVTETTGFYQYDTVDVRICRCCVQSPSRKDLELSLNFNIKYLLGGRSS